MSMYGSANVGFFLVGGYSMLATSLQGLSESHKALQEETDGLGDSWAEWTPTGMRVASLSQDGAFFDAGTDLAHEALQDDQQTSRVVCLNVEGNTLGQRFVGYAGTYAHKYSVLGKLKGLTKADVDYTITGNRDEGVILQPLATKTADWNTESSESYDSGASSADGGIGFLQVTAFSGFTGFIGTVRDSADDVTFADLVTFTNVTAAPAAETVTVSGTVDRYLAVDGNVTGTGSITAFVGFARR